MYRAPLLIAGRWPTLSRTRLCAVGVGTASATVGTVVGAVGGGGGLVGVDVGPCGPQAAIRTHRRLRMAATRTAAMLNQLSAMWAAMSDQLAAMWAAMSDQRWLPCQAGMLDQCWLLIFAVDAAQHVA